MEAGVSVSDIEYHGGQHPLPSLIGKEISLQDDIPESGTGCLTKFENAMTSGPILFGRDCSPAHAAGRLNPFSLGQARHRPAALDQRMESGFAAAPLLGGDFAFLRDYAHW
jgi:hypothetical protein